MVKKVQIEKALKEDAGRGLIRIDSDIIEELDLKVGDVIEIAQPILNKKTAALLYKPLKGDKGTNKIRIDKSHRRNIEAALGDIVEIRKIEAPLANEVIFAGHKEPVILRNAQALARKLENRVITKNDILSFISKGRRLDLIIVDYNPKYDAVRIHVDTKITVIEKKIELFIFMLLPLTHPQLKQIYEKYIKKSLEKKGFIVKSALDFYKPTSIMEDILDSITEADVIIAELTNQNPNVCYELGRAHEKGKYVIQICQKEQDISFGLRQIRTIFYDNNLVGYESLQNQIKKYIDNYFLG